MAELDALLPTLAALPAPETFVAQASKLGVELEPADVERLGRFLAMMLQANTRFNLTAITDPTEAWRRHILDAISIMPVLASLLPESASTQPGPHLRVADVGSGGGVPALPLAALLPDVQFVLMEPTGKKAAFLRSAAKALGCTNVQVLPERAEKLGQDHREHRERYDVAMARAVGALPMLSELLLPLVKMGGIAVAIKGERAEEELAAADEAITTLGGEHDQTLVTPTGKLVLLAKVRPTPRPYPRQGGEIARSPLGAGRTPRPGDVDRARPGPPRREGPGRPPAEGQGDDAG